MAEFGQNRYKISTAQAYDGDNISIAAQVVDPVMVPVERRYILLGTDPDNPTPEVSGQEISQQLELLDGQLKAGKHVDPGDANEVYTSDYTDAVNKKLQRAIQFTGADIGGEGNVYKSMFVDLGDNPKLKGLNDFTFCCWMLTETDLLSTYVHDPTDDEDENQFTLFGGVGMWFWFHKNTLGQKMMFAAMRDDYDHISGWYYRMDDVGIDVDDGDWHHIAFIFLRSSGTMRFYHNGSGVDMSPQSGVGWDLVADQVSPTFTGEGHVCIGGFDLASLGNANHFDMSWHYMGWLDDVRFGHVAWSDTEIEAVYNSGDGTEFEADPNKADVADCQLLQATFADPDGDKVIDNPYTENYGGTGQLKGTKTDTELHNYDTVYGPGGVGVEIADCCYFKPGWNTRIYYENIPAQVPELEGEPLEFALSLWMRPEDETFYANTRLLMCKQAKGSGYKDWRLAVTGGSSNDYLVNIDFKLWGGGADRYVQVKSANRCFHEFDQGEEVTTIKTPIWRHIVINVLAGQSKNPADMIKIYVDGIQDRQVWSKYHRFKDPEDRGDLVVVGGNVGNTNGMKGYMADVRMFNRTLSYNEIQYLYGDGTGTFSLSGSEWDVRYKTLGYWKMNDNRATSRVRNNHYAPRS